MLLLRLIAGLYWIWTKDLDLRMDLDVPICLLDVIKFLLYSILFLDRLNTRELLLDNLSLDFLSILFRLMLSPIFILELSPNTLD